MSPDDALAASLWTWPDPLLKRDRAGRVMFVNAAFLGLYGGRVQDWSGNVVTGWPAPSANGAQRFETRAGEAPAQIIYDWVEMPMADGNVLAIARDVTMFSVVAQPSVQESTTSAEMPDGAMPPAQTTPLAQPAVETPTQAPSQVSVEASAEPAQSAPVSTPEPSTPQTSTPAQPAASQAVPQGQVMPVAVQQEVGEEERMIERRALPIEDSSSVLGANWRDQVIAKATGTEIEPDDGTSGTSQSQESGDESIVGPGTKVADGLKILLAEDNAINALLTRTLLEAEGADVETVEDGALAVQAMKENTYDLIFMDMRMPNMDGLEATRKIRAQGATLPIIALTANAFDDDRNACFDSGMNDFMTKPVSAEELIDMVSEWTKKDKAA